MPAIVNSNNLFLGSTGGGASVHYTAGPNIDITENIISGKDWSTEIESATSGKLDTTAFNTGDFYPMTGNPSGFLTAHQSLTAYQPTADMTAYYQKNETSSKEQISAALSGLTGDSVDLSAGDGISIVETANKVVISCTATGSPIDTGAFYPMTGNPSGFLTAHQSLSNYYRKNETSSKTEIANALQNAGHEYTGIAPIGVNNSTYQISAETWTLSAGEGLVLSEDSNAKVATISITGSTGGSNIHWYVDTPVEHTSADIDLTIQTTASLGGGYDRNLLDGNGNFIGALIPSAASEDLGKVLTITAGSPRWQNLPETPSGAYGIKTEVVANSGLATGQNILYIVTGN